tara:strand:+ start:2747 stop:3535 length:789 start_codon:yes stop_codon:yes gene_type:complete
MKVALCFSGKLGDWKECSESIIKNIISPLKPDIFLSTWDDEPYEDFVKFYKPASWQAINFEETMKLLKPENLAYEPNAGLIPMLAGIKAVNSIFQRYQQLKKKDYDLVIRLRPDVMVLEQIKKHEIKDCLKNKNILLPLFESDNIYDHEEELKKEFSFSFVYDKASLPNQINDQIAIGRPEQMNKYMNSLMSVGMAIKMLWDEGYPEYMIKVPESVMTICLNMQQCRYKQLTGTNSFGNIQTVLCKDGKKWRNKGHNSTIVK